MVAPDVQIEDGKGTILISSEEGETEGVTAVGVSSQNVHGHTKYQSDQWTRSIAYT